MTREEFHKINKGVYVVETYRYLNNPGIYAILIQDIEIIAYKNPNLGEQITSATIWAESCQSLSEAYQAIDSYIKKTKSINKQLLKK